MGGLKNLYNFGRFCLLAVFSIFSAIQHVVSQVFTFLLYEETYTNAFAFSRKLHVSKILFMVLESFFLSVLSIQNNLFLFISNACIHHITSRVAYKRAGNSMQVI